MYYNLEFAYPLTSRLHRLPGNKLRSNVCSMEKMIGMDVGAESSSKVSVEVIHVAQHFEIESNLHVILHGLIIITTMILSFRGMMFLYGAGIIIKI